MSLEHKPYLKSVRMYLFVSIFVCIPALLHGFGPLLQSTWHHRSAHSSSLTIQSANTEFEGEVTAKSLTNEIMTFFSVKSSSEGADYRFKKRLTDPSVIQNLDGMHILTTLFQCARSRRLAKSVLPIELMVNRLQSWNKTWSERDISTFVYGIRSIEGLDKNEVDLLKLGAKNIKKSPVVLSSRAIGNALYGLQDLTSSTVGSADICKALAEKVALFEGDLNGQDIGIGLYGLQGMSATVPEVRALVGALAQKIAMSETEFDAQAMSNALYGLQSMDSDYSEVLALVSALAAKVSQSTPQLCAQAVGSALYGLQKLSSDKLEVRTLISALTEKIETSTLGLDAQAVGNALFGMQRMRSDSAEVRNLAQSMADMLLRQTIKLDSKAIGAAVYGLHLMSSDVPQVRSLLAALGTRISTSTCFLNGQGIADALYGLSAMRTDCDELRLLLRALADRIDVSQGKLDSQEIGNALSGFQGLSSEMGEVRLIAMKVAEKIKRSNAVMQSQHIGRAILGLQRLSADSQEIRYLVKQLSKRIAQSDRTRLTAQAIADSLYGLQGLTSDVEEVQELAGELAKKISVTAAVLSPVQWGSALFGLQGLTSSAGLLESAIGLDSDEVSFLLSTVWDKIKVVREPMPLSACAMAIQGLISLKDPISENIRQYIYARIVFLGEIVSAPSFESGETATTVQAAMAVSGGTASMTAASQMVSGDLKPSDVDIVKAYRALKLSGLVVPEWLAQAYDLVQTRHKTQPVVRVTNRQEKLVTQRYTLLHPTEKMQANDLVEGFRLALNFPEFKLNIELDSSSNRFSARVRYHKLRDTFVMNSLGYEVRRLPLDGKTPDELAAEIDAIVKTKQDLIVEKDIQKLYSKDRDVRLLYTNRNPSSPKAVTATTTSKAVSGKEKKDAKSAAGGNPKEKWSPK